MSPGDELGGALRAEPGLDAVADQHVLGDARVVAAEGTPGALPVAVGEDRERRRLQHAEVLAQPEPAAEPARALGVLDEREPGDLHRVVQLRLLDRRVLGVLAVGLDRVGAVAPVPAAVAPGERLVEARVAPAGDVERAEARLAHHPLRPGREPLGERGQERAEHHLDETRLGLPAADDRRGPGAVRDRALRRVEAEQPVEAVVHRQVGVDQALERVGAGREVIANVELTGARRCGSDPVVSKWTPSGVISILTWRRTGSSV